MEHASATKRKQGEQAGLEASKVITSSNKVKDDKATSAMRAQPGP